MTMMIIIKVMMMTMTMLGIIENDDTVLRLLMVSYLIGFYTWQRTLRARLIHDTQVPLTSMLFNKIKERFF